MRLAKTIGTLAAATGLVGVLVGSASAKCVPPQDLLKAFPNRTSYGLYVDRNLDNIAQSHEISKCRGDLTIYITDNYFEVKNQKDKIVRQGPPVRIFEVPESGEYTKVFKTNRLQEFLYETASTWNPPADAVFFSSEPDRLREWLSSYKIFKPIKINSIEALAKQLEKYDIVLIGENHLIQEGPVAQQAIIKELGKSQKLIVGHEGLYAGTERGLEDYLRSTKSADFEGLFNAVRAFHPAFFEDDVSLINYLKDNGHLIMPLELGYGFLASEKSDSLEFRVMEANHDAFRNVAMAYQTGIAADSGKKVGKKVVDIVGSAHTRPIYYTLKAPYKTSVVILDLHSLGVVSGLPQEKGIFQIGPDIFIYNTGGQMQR